MHTFQLNQTVRVAKEGQEEEEEERPPHYLCVSSFCSFAALVKVLVPVGGTGEEGWG